MTSPTQVGLYSYPAGYDRPVASALRYIMERVVATFDAANVDLPDMRLVTVGSVSVDGPLLAVMFGGIAVGPPGNEMTTPLRHEAPRTVTVNVELWRRAPALSDAGAVPTPDAISAAAEIIMNDTWLLLEGAYASDQMGVGIIANATVNEPNGEMQGVAMALEVQIP